MRTLCRQKCQTWHGAGMVPEKRPGATKKAAAKKAKKTLQDCCPPMILTSAAKSVSADPPAFDPLVPFLASLNSCILPIGIKATVEGKSKQIMSFGGLKVGKTTEDLRSIGHAAVGKLREGQVPERRSGQREKQSEVHVHVLWCMLIMIVK